MWWVAITLHWLHELPKVGVVDMHKDFKDSLCFKYLYGTLWVAIWSIDEWKSDFVEIKFHSNENIEWDCMHLVLNVNWISNWTQFNSNSIEKKWYANWWRRFSNLLVNVMLKNKNFKNTQIQKYTFPCFFTWEWARQILGRKLVRWNTMGHYSYPIYSCPT
jgi:hypothetical protein